jgi:hypothetical protein
MLNLPVVNSPTILSETLTTGQYAHGNGLYSCQQFEAPKLNANRKRLSACNYTQMADRVIGNAAIPGPIQVLSTAMKQHARPHPGAWNSLDTEEA